VVKKLNNVLNRPLFRKEALRKGDLKPIKAQTGIMVGMPTGGPQIVKPRSLPVPAGPVVDKTPGKFMRGIQNAISGAADYMDPTNPKMYRGIGNVGVDVVAGQGLYNIGKGITGSEAGGVAAGIGGLFNPVTRGAGVIAGAGNLINKYVLDGKYDPKTNVFSTRFGNVSNFMPKSTGQLAELKEKEMARKAAEKKQRNISRLLKPQVTGDISGLSYGMEADSTDFKYMSADQQDKLIKRQAAELAKETGISETKAANIVRASFFEGVNNNQAKRAIVDEGAYQQNIPNKYKDPKISLASATQTAEASEGAETPTPTPVVKKEEQPQKIGDAKVDQKKQNTTAVDEPTKILDGGLISRAREIAKELGQGRSSNANLVFLANLASGLLKGKTAKSGLGGALEVLGAALGPATSNYAIMKLKEDEINNKLMGEALDAASAELKTYATIAAAQAKGGKAESFGAIQAIGPNGEIVNFEGQRQPDGTLIVRNPDGTDVVTRIGQQIPGGYQVSQYIDRSKNAEQIDTTMRAIGSRVKSAGYAKQSLEIIDLDPSKAGAVGAFNLLTSRVGSALEDIGLGGYTENLDGAKAKLKLQTEQMRKSADAALKDGEITQDQYDEMKKLWTGADKRVNDVLRRYKGSIKDKDRKDLEQLAVNEVTLTYALANSFKDKDRLTARDVQAAKEIVNIFTWTRGSKSVKASLEAIENNLNTDINGYARDLQRLGVSQVTIDNLLKDYDPSKFAKRVEKAGKQFNQKALDDIIGGIEVQ